MYFDLSDCAFTGNCEVAPFNKDAAPLCFVSYIRSLSLPLLWVNLRGVFAGTLY